MLNTSTIVRTFVAATAAVAFFFAATKPAAADSFNIQYFSAPTSSSPTSDFHDGNVPTGGISTSNYVTTTLGPDLMPVFVGAGFNNDGGAVSAPGAAYLNSHNEILYWTAGQNGIVAVGSGTINLSSTPTNMFVPSTTGSNIPYSSGGNNSTLEETAILTGSFNLATASTVQFNVGADDEAFVYLDGNLIETLAGIHGDTAGPSASETLAAGSHTVEIFYADLDITQASLSFSDLATPVTITPSVPEPSTFFLFGTGLLGAAGVIRRRFVR